MRTEVPVFKRCCFCLPLRYGLLAWSYFSLLLCILSAIRITYYIKYLIRFDEEWMMIVDCTLDILCETLNFAVTLLLIVAAHRKNVRLLEICVVGGLIAVGGNVVRFLWSFITFCSDDVFNEAWIIYWIFFFICDWLAYIGVQLYVIALVRSEILKLENNHSYQFQNLAAQVERGYYEAETMKIDEQAPETVNVDKEIDSNNVHKQALLKRERTIQ